MSNFPAFPAFPTVTVGNLEPLKAHNFRALYLLLISDFKNGRMGGWKMERIREGAACVLIARKLRELPLLTR